jgi:hypothetical protein
MKPLVLEPVNPRPKVMAATTDGAARQIARFVVMSDTVFDLDALRSGVVCGVAGGRCPDVFVVTRLSG